MTNETLKGKLDAGNPHVRFDEGEVTSAKPRRGALLYTGLKLGRWVVFGLCFCIAGMAAENDTVQIIARGIGMDKASALKDAYRDAIERTVGLYVDAEAMARNDELVENKILTHSNAYVESYEEIGTRAMPGGLCQVRISAVVRRRQLAASLKKLDLQGEVHLSGSLSDVHAQLATEAKRTQDAATLLTAKLDGVNPIRMMIRPRILPDSRVITKAGQFPPDNRFGQVVPEGKIAISYLVSFQLDTDVYRKEFLPLLTDVLGQISTGKPSLVRLSSVEGRWTNSDDLGKFLSKGLKTMGRKSTHVSPMRDNGMYRGVFVYEGLLDGTMLCFKPALDCVSNTGHDCFRFSSSGFYAGAPLEYDDKWQQGDVIVINDWNKRMSSAKATAYHLDAKCTGVLARWMRGLGVDARQSTRNVPQPFVVTFLDAAGKEVVSYNKTVPKDALMNVGTCASHYNSVDHDDYLVSPFVGCAGQEFLLWCDFVMGEDELAEIKSVQVEFAE